MKTEDTTNEPELSFQIRAKKMRREKSKEYLINLEDFEIVSSIKNSDFSEINLVQDQKTLIQYVAKTIKMTTNQYNSNNNYDDEKDYILSDYIFFLSQYQHPTIMKFIGFSINDFQGRNYPTILMEPSSKDSLEKVLNEIYHSLLSFNDKLQYSGSIILIGIARSMMLLHKHNIIHGDLKPSNILLDENFYPYLTDFTDPKMFDGELPYTPIYSAPEVLKKQQFSEKSDVYSFGMIMYKVVTETDPFSSLSPDEIDQKIKDGFHPNFESSPIIPSLRDLIERCLSPDPNERPSFEEIFINLAYDQENYFDSDSQIADKILDYIDIIESYLTFCKICQEKIDQDDIVFYSHFPYHKKCIKCIECNKVFDLTCTIDDFCCIAPGMFYCKNHYYDYIEYKNCIPENHFELYHDKIVENLVEDEFDASSFKNENIVGYTPDEIFIDSEMIDNSFNKDKPYDIFIPNAKFKFEFNPAKIDFSELQTLLGDEFIILNVEQGCTFLKIAFLATRRLKNIESRFNELLEPLIDRFHSTTGQSILGNMVNEPETNIPDDQLIQNFCKKKSINLLQNTIDLNQIELKYIQEEINSLLSKKKFKNWNFVFENQCIFDEAEKQVRNDIENNAFEMIIVGQTVIANKYFRQYNSIKRKIPKENVLERFLYHGSRLSNHQKIVKTHFLMPGEDKMKQIDKGYFGQGIYATENMFYAAVYGNKFSVLNINEKTSIICCRVIYNSSRVKHLENLCYGQKILPEIANNYGVNHAVVGSNNRFEPITNDERENNLIIAEEFVFPKKYQIIPICSFTVMRTDYYILWKDEHITNNENTRYMKDLSKKIEVNVYFKNSVEEAINLIRLKKYNKIKLITNGGHELTGKKLIEEARKIIQSNFVCLVFAGNENHLSWVLEMENVIFTTSPTIFREFAELKMNMIDVLNFIHKLEESSHVTFNINENELLKFPLTKKRDRFYNYQNESDDDQNPAINIGSNNQNILSENQSNYQNNQTDNSENQNNNSNNANNVNNNLNDNSNEQNQNVHPINKKKKCQIF